MCLLTLAPALPVRAETRVGGEIPTSTTWTLAGSPYVLDSAIYVRGGSAPVLTIEPGVVVKVATGQVISVGDGTAGTLNAIATAERPILFTTTGTPVAGAWQGIYLGNGAGGSRLEHAVVEGGGRDYKAGIRVAESAPVLKNVTVRTTYHRGIHVAAGGAPRITDSTVTATTGADGTGIHVSAGGRLEITDTLIQGSANGAITVEPRAELAGLTGLTLTDNGQNGVRHRGGELGTSETWKSFGYPYYLIDGGVYVRGGSAPVLTIEPGVVVKVAAGQVISAGDGTAGTLKAIGTAERPILFTTTGTPVAGAWQGIYLGNGAGGSRLEHAVVEGGGRDYKAGIRVAESSPVLRNVTVRTTYHRGIHVAAGGAPRITDSTVTATTGADGTGIHVSAGGRLEITDTLIQGSANGAITVEPRAELAGLTGLTLTDNGQNGVRHRGGELGTSETWKSFGYPYYLIDGGVYVRGGSAPVLTIEPGVVVKVAAGQVISAGDGTAGTLKAIGTAERPILFTTTGTPVAGAWQGIYLGNGAGGSRLEHAVVEGGGRDYKAGIRVAESSPVLRNVTVRTTYHRGIHVAAGGAPRITDSTVTATTGADGTGIHVSAGGRLEITDTLIQGSANGAITVEPRAELAGLTGLTLTDNGQNGVRHRGGELGTSETWKSFGYPYYLIDGGVYVRGGSAPVLTIEPGVVVKVAAGQVISAGDGTAGTLKAIGTAERPILFTTTGTPVAGAWQGIYLGNGAGGSRLEHAVVEGGGRDYKAGIRVAESSPVLRNVTVRTTYHRGIHVAAGGAPRITDSTVTATTGADGTGIHVSAGGRLEITDTLIQGSANGAITVEPRAELAGLTGLTLTDNGQNGVRHRGGELGTSETWKSFGYPYYLIDGGVYVRGGSAPVLTIEPGVVVKAAAGQVISAGDGTAGTLNAIGTAEKPILFTTTGTPVAGAWHGLYLGNGAGGSRLEQIVVEGGGRDYKAGIRVAESSPVLRNVTVRTTYHRGIYVAAGGAPRITDSTVTATTGADGTGIHLSSGSAAEMERTTASANSGSGIVNEGSRASLRFVTLSGNGGDGLRSTAGDLSLRDGVVTGQAVPVRNADMQARVVDARQQWWGSAAGPAGLVGRVESDPWLGAPPTPAFAVTSLDVSTRAFPPSSSSVRFDIALPSIANWVLSLLGTDGREARRFDGTGRAATVRWDGTGAFGAALPDGEYRVRLEAIDESTGHAAAPLLGRISLDGSLPTAVLTAPSGLAGATVGDEVTIEGSAGGAGFQSYVLEAGEGDFPSSWAIVDRGILPVTEGRLGTFTTALLSPGRYTLRLSVTGGAGKVASSTVRIDLFEEGECR